MHAVSTVTAFTIDTALPLEQVLIDLLTIYLMAICGLHCIRKAKWSMASGSRLTRAPSQIPKPACSDGWRLVSEPIVFLRVSPRSPLLPLSPFIHHQLRRTFVLRYWGFGFGWRGVKDLSAEFERCYVSVAIGRDDTAAFREPLH